MNKIEAIEHAIRHATGNEHLLELSFGCLWKDRDTGQTYKQINGGDYNNEDAWVNFINDKNQITALEFEERDGRELEVIGHPIQPHHLLKALKKQIYVYTLDGDGYLRNTHLKTTEVVFDLTHPNPVRHALETDEKFLDWCYETLVGNK